MHTMNCCPWCHCCIIHPYFLNSGSTRNFLWGHQGGKMLSDGAKILKKLPKITDIGNFILLIGGLGASGGRASSWGGKCPHNPLILPLFLNCYTSHQTTVDWCLYACTPTHATQVQFPPSTVPQYNGLYLKIRHVIAVFCEPLISSISTFSAQFR